MRLPSRTDLIAMAKAPLKFTVAQRVWLGAGIGVALMLIWLAWPRPMSVEIADIDRGVVRSEVVDEARTRIHDVFVVAAPVSGESSVAMNAP